MSTKLKACFLFSMPRSGSTLLQRMLAVHERVGSAAEPWVLLPYLYTMRYDGIVSHYSHFQAVRAIHDFCREFPKGEQDYLDSLAEFVMSLYRKAAQPDVEYFLDKSPPYCLIAGDIMRLLPDAKAVFLFRSPGQIAASICETFDEGRWSVPSWKPYLYDGMSHMISAYEEFEDRSLRVNYESLIKDPEASCRRIVDYLEVDYDPRMISDFSNVKFKGNLGDQTGRFEYNKVSREPLEKWKKTLANPIRKNWLKRYLKWLGPERINSMGYQFDEQMNDAKEISSGMRYLFSDSLRVMRSMVSCIIEPHQIRAKLKKLPAFNQIHKHY
ncbi:MAG: sulfotransferase [Planctomycetota bacterium]